MNCEETSTFGSRNLLSSSICLDVLNQSMIPEKLNPHKISKQTYANLPLSQKAITNIRRNSSYKRNRSRNGSQVLKNISISDLEACGLNNCCVVQQIPGLNSQIEERSKENFCIENLPQIENVQEMYEPKSATLKPSHNLLSTYNGTPQSECQNRNPNKLSRFATFDSIPRDYSDEVSGRYGRGLNTPKCKTTRHSSQENDYSDKDTMEESASYVSDNIGSHNRFVNSSARAENSFERDTEVRGPFWTSQENSYCTTLDCEDAAGYNNSALLTAKKTDSLQDALEFEQEFVLFSSANTTPNNKMRIDETPIKQEKMRSIEEELAEFNPEINPCAFDSETINYLIMRENDYCPDPHYLKKKQNQINWTMRAILFDWMMEVCMEFGLKRETYHYAINYVDRYLSAVPNLPKIELQLIGVTALYMAAKVEEIYPPRVASFAKSTDGAYSTEQINAMELKMAKALKWLMTPPTLNTWANWYMNQWDLYVERSAFAQSHPLIQAIKEDLIQFKQSNQKSYGRYRELMQMIDCAVLDAQTLQYKPRALIASVMYVLLGKYFNQFNSNQMFEQFPNNNYYLVDKTSQFNQLFGNFLSYSFGFELNDLLPSVQYVATYVKLPLSLEMPKAVKMNKENILEVILRFKFNKLIFL